MNWNDVLTNTLGGLISGGFLVLIGYFVWKKQHLYTKKLDVYIKVLTQLKKIRTTFFISIGLGSFNIDENEFIQQANIIKSDISDLDLYKYEFEIHFGNSYNKVFADIDMAFYKYIAAYKKLKQSDTSEKDKKLCTKFLTDVSHENPVFRTVDNAINIITSMYDFSSKKFNSISKTKKKYKKGVAN